MWETIKNHTKITTLRTMCSKFKQAIVEDPVYLIITFTILGCIAIVGLSTLFHETSIKYITLDPGQKFMDVDFRHYDLYITTRPMRDDEYPEEYTIKSNDGEFVYYIQEIKNNRR